MTRGLKMLSLLCLACRRRWCATEPAVILPDRLDCLYCGAPEHEIEVTLTW